MVKPAKLHGQLIVNPRTIITFRDFERLIVAFGFRHVRTTGSHKLYVHPAISRPYPVQPTGKDAKPYQVRELLELIELHGLQIKE